MTSVDRHAREPATGGGGELVVGHPMVVGYRVQYAATVMPFWHAMHVADKAEQQAIIGGDEAVGHSIAVGLAAQYSATVMPALQAMHVADMPRQQTRGGVASGERAGAGDGDGESSGDGGDSTGDGGGESTAGAVHPALHTGATLTELAITKTPLSRTEKKLVGPMGAANAVVIVATAAEAAAESDTDTETRMVSGEPPIVIDTAAAGTFSC